MKSVVVLCLAILVGLVTSSDKTKDKMDIHPRGCIYDDVGMCIQECPVGTHSYTTGCGPVTPEPSCSNPYPEQGDDVICDLSVCYCDPPTLRDDKYTWTCVLPEDCPIH